MAKAAPKKPQEENPRKAELTELREHIKDMRGLLHELEDRSPEKLRRIKKLVASVPEGKFLLDFAAKSKTKISFGRRMPGLLAGLTESGGKVFDTHSHGPGFVATHFTVTLDAQSTERELACTLAHELRHVWQNVTLKEKSLSLSPKLSLTLSRLQEGDARAFEAYFKQRLEEKEQGRPRAKFSTAQWKEAFMDFQNDKELSYGYDKNIVEATQGILKKVKELMPEKEVRRKALSAVFNKSAKAGLGNADKILRAGFSKNAKPYMTFKDPAQMARKISALAKPSTQRKIAKLERAIRTGG